MLLPADDRERVLRGALEGVRDSYDVILLDCTPSLGLLTLNALGAADEVLIPVQCEMLSHRGVGQLLDTVADVQRLLNPDLRVRGLLPTMFDGRVGHARAVLADLGDRYERAGPHADPAVGAVRRGGRHGDVDPAHRAPLRRARRLTGRPLPSSWRRGARRASRPLETAAGPRAARRTAAEAVQAVEAVGHPADLTVRGAWPVCRPLLCSGACVSGWPSCPSSSSP